MTGAVSQLLGESAQDPYVLCPRPLRRTEGQPIVFAMISSAAKVCAAPAGELGWRTQPTWQYLSISAIALTLYDYLLVFDDEVSCGRSCLLTF